MYAFRDRYAKEWGLNFIRELCPPIEATDPTLPPAGRARPRARRWACKAAIEKHGFNGLIAGHPARRGGDPRQGALLLARATRPAVWNLKDQPPEFWDQYKTELPGGHACPHASAAALDRGRHLALHQAREHPASSISTSPRTASATARSATTTSPRPIVSEAATLDEIIAELETTKIPERSGRAMDHESEDAFERLRAPATCEVLPMTTPAPRETRQLKIVIVGHVDHGKSTLVGRLFHDTGSLPEGKLEAIKAHVRAARHAVRVGLPDGRAPGRARPGHHHRHDADPLQDRRSAPYVIIDAPGHKEFLKNMVTGAAAAEAALLLIDADEGVQEQSRRHGYLLHLLGVDAGRGAGQQDGPGRLVGRPLRPGGRGLSRLSRGPRRRARRASCRSPPARATTCVGHSRACPGTRARRVVEVLDGFHFKPCRDRPAAAPAGAGRLQVRPAPDHRRPHRERPARGRRPGDLLAVEQDGADRSDRGLERAGAGRRGRGRAVASASPSTSRSSSSAARS